MASFMHEMFSFAFEPGFYGTGFTAVDDVAAGHSISKILVFGHATTLVLAIVQHAFWLRSNSISYLS